MRSQVIRIYRFIFLLFLLIFNQNLRAINIISDSEIQNTIESLVNPLILASGYKANDVKIYIYADKSPNAFVAGGRNIFISTRMITIFNDPLVIKGVVAHELGHIRGAHLAHMHHNFENLFSRYAVGGLIGIGALIAGAPEVGTGLVFGSMEALNKNMLKYSRIHEESADQAAIDLLKKTNTSPSGLIKLLKHFYSQSKYKTSNMEYYSTHPLDKKRIDVLEAYAAKTKDFAASSEEVQKYSRIYAKTLAFLSPKEFLKITDKNLDQNSLDYGLAISNFKTNNYQQAFAILNRLSSLEPKNPYIFELKAEFLSELGKINEAVFSFEEAIRLNPNSNELRYSYASALINLANKTKSKTDLLKATTILNSIIVKDPQNFIAYRKLAMCYGKLGDYARSNLMLANMEVILGNKKKAKEFAKRAKKLAKNDKQLNLKIDDLLQMQ